ncbi:MAG: dephospho-CoA kinase [Thermotogota bacterium]|nr:dephospho-CoA kinase [Thermotogota bacterium]
MLTSIHISVGLTGLMGSGKSEVANYLKRTGFPVLFMDQVGHDCLQDDEVIQTLVNSFSVKVLDESNKINRKKLSAIVFNDPKELKKLNAILHPKMNENAKGWIKKQFKKGQKIVFIEAAILFEMQMNKFLDYIVLIKASEKNMIDRIIKRDQKSEVEIQQILQAQKTNEDRFDYVIINDGSLEELHKNCVHLINGLKLKL